MIDKVRNDDCTLCGACANSCPVDAISFNKYANTFNYPSIDMNKCISCNLCEVKCPVLNNKAQLSLRKCYASKSQDCSVRFQSTSGGVFYELSKYVLKNKGFVCGCIMNENFKTLHIFSKDINDIKKMMGSKYVQSDIGDVYKKIESLLKEGYLVLFSGCPCQIAGLRSYLVKSYDNLILLDFVCHGILSQDYFNSYLNFVNKKDKDIKNIKFRDKNYGWHCSSVVIEYVDGTKYIKPIVEDPYMKTLLNSYFLKESCFSCKFRNLSSGSDFTVSDFWGIEVVNKKIDDNLGVSGLIINTSKGNNIIKDLDLDLFEVSYSDIFTYNKSLEQSAAMNSERNSFISTFNSEGFSGVYKKYLKESLRDKIRRYTQETLNKIWLIFFKRKRNNYYK